MKKLNAVMMMGAMMAMAGETNFIETNHYSPKKTEPKKIIPKGCKEYFFVISGRFFNENPGRNYEIVYECIAASDKSAERKFTNWKSRHKFT